MNDGEVDIRVQGLDTWARASGSSLGIVIPDDAGLVPVSDDASFRRYFRYPSGAEGLVFVDAPPEHEDNESFVRIAAALQLAGINCPEVKLCNLESGYLAISDLGNRIYLAEMQENPDRIHALYTDAVDVIARLQTVTCDVPMYDEGRLAQEMSLFDDWFLRQQLKLTSVDQGMLVRVCDLLVESAISQPQRFVHRDFHCRNLMVMDDADPGVLDFQDAVIGPVTYDLVSLYKDCYYRFEREVVVDAVSAFKNRLVEAGVLAPSADLLRSFDLMGAQRHLKCAGIFSRLNLRDGKPGYLGDIPLVIDYLVEVSDLYEELAEFADWLKLEIQPRMKTRPFTRASN